MTPQPGNRVSCLCLRCVALRACMREATRDQGVSRHVFVPSSSPSPASPAPPSASFAVKPMIFLNTFFDGYCKTAAFLIRFPLHRVLDQMSLAEYCKSAPQIGCPAVARLPDL